MTEEALVLNLCELPGGGCHLVEIELGDRIDIDIKKKMIEQA